MVSTWPYAIIIAPPVTMLLVFAIRIATKPLRRLLPSWLARILFFSW